MRVLIFTLPLSFYFLSVHPLFSLSLSCPGSTVPLESLNEKSNVCCIPPGSESTYTECSQTSETCYYCRGDCKDLSAKICTGKHDSCFTYVYNNNKVWKGCMEKSRWDEHREAAEKRNGGLKYDRTCVGSSCNGDDISKFLEQK